MRVVSPNGQLSLAIRPHDAHDTKQMTLLQVFSSIISGIDVHSA